MSRQFAGKTCVACKTKIALQTEGTFCVFCNAIFHESCVNKSSGRCPSCSEEWSDPKEELYIYFQLCPVCGLFTKERLESCRHCGNRMYVDSVEDLKEYYERISRSRNQDLIIGLSCLIIGTFCILGFFITVAYPIKGKLMLWIGTFTLGFFTLLKAFPRLAAFRIRNSFYKVYRQLIT